VHVPCENKSDDVNDSFSYEELGRVFDQFPKYNMEILLGDFNVIVGREDLFVCVYACRHVCTHAFIYECVHVYKHEGMRKQSVYMCTCINV
jgi:hypothetical protein